MIYFFDLKASKSLNTDLLQPEIFENENEELMSSTSSIKFDKNKFRFLEEFVKSQSELASEYLKKENLKNEDSLSNFKDINKSIKEFSPEPEFNLEEIKKISLQSPNIHQNNFKNLAKQLNEFPPEQLNKKNEEIFTNIYPNNFKEHDEFINTPLKPVFKANEEFITPTSSIVLDTFNGRDVIDNYLQESDSKDVIITPKNLDLKEISNLSSNDIFDFKDPSIIKLTSKKEIFQENNVINQLIPTNNFNIALETSEMYSDNQSKENIYLNNIKSEISEVDFDFDRKNQISKNIHALKEKKTSIDLFDLIPLSLNDKDLTLQHNTSTPRKSSKITNPTILTKITEVLETSLMSPKESNLNLSVHSKKENTISKGYSHKEFSFKNFFLDDIIIKKGKFLEEKMRRSLKVLVESIILLLFSFNNLFI